MFAENLKKFRTRTGMSQSELADRVGSSVSYIGKLENGFKPAPSGELLLRLAELFKCTTDELLK